MNITNIDVYVEVQNHPYATAIIVLLCFFVVGVIVSFFGNVHKGVKTVGKGLYYITSPLHFPVRWAYNRI